jgi:transposase
VVAIESIPLRYIVSQRLPAVEFPSRAAPGSAALLSAAEKTSHRKQCGPLATRFLKAICQFRQASLAQLVRLGEALQSWATEIATMWRFTKNKGITEGLHTKMEVLQRQAHGFRNFNN